MKNCQLCGMPEYTSFCEGYIIEFACGSSFEINGLPELRTQSRQCKYIEKIHKEQIKTFDSYEAKIRTRDNEIESLKAHCSVMRFHFKDCWNNGNNEGFYQAELEHDTPKPIYSEQLAAEYLNEDKLRRMTHLHHLQCRCGYCTKLMFVVKD